MVDYETGHGRVLCHCCPSVTSHHCAVCPHGRPRSYDSAGLDPNTSANLCGPGFARYDTIRYRDARKN